MESSAMEASAAQADLRPKASHALLLTGAQAAKWSLRGVFALIVARSLGPPSFGVYAVLYAMVEFLAVASGSGYIDYLTRETAKDARVGWGLAFQLIGLRIAIAVPVAALEVGILFVLGYPHAAVVGTAWMCLTLVPRSLSEAVQGVLRGLHRYTSYLVVELALGAGLLAGGIVLLVRGSGLRTVIQTEIGAALVAGFVAFGFGLRFRAKNAVGLTASVLVRKSAVFNLYSFIATLYDRFDVVVLSKLGGNYATGIYSVAYRAMSVTQVLAYGVLYSLLPTLSRSGGTAGGRRRVEKAMGVLMSTAFVLVLGTMVFSGPAVKLILGTSYAESAVALKILIWAVILRYMNYTLNVELLAAGREKIFVVTSLVCSGVNFFGNIIFIPIYSWWAAAVLTIITELVLLGQNVFWMRRVARGVSLPWGAARNSLVFAVLFLVAMAGGYLGAPLVVGSACLVLFGAYLYRSGICSDLSVVWSAEGSM